MQGYMTIMTEAWQQGGFETETGSACYPTHVFLQIGVGSFSGGMAGFLVNKMKTFRQDIKIIVVEPRGAHCVFRSNSIGDGAAHGSLTLQKAVKKLEIINYIFSVMEGDLVTVMAGLNCGTPSNLGWPILKNSVSAYLSCEDEVTYVGMRAYYYPIEGNE